ncbi:C40 family peptidase [Neobacillus sp. LXY-4]|uniref:C40 family peptidase n=1 Tax=Neobacillus sp. LXY-4 TaxID=3379826 RepID=UPI003EE01107
MKKIILLFTLALSLAMPLSSLAYTVKPGDTMYTIAKRHGITFSQILKLNPQIKDPSNLIPGQHVNTGYEKAELIIDYAVSTQGKTQYVYGADPAKAPWISDCSSWTQFIYKRYGISLPRTSVQQSKVGTPLTFQQLRKGDLMFFGTNGRVTHVGIYMGNGYYISNLNPTKDVQIYSVYESWSYRTFLWGSRVL